MKDAEDNCVSVSPFITKKEEEEEEMKMKPPSCAVATGRMHLDDR